MPRDGVHLCDLPLLPPPATSLGTLCPLPHLMHLHSGHLPLLTIAQILFFLDSGSLHMVFPLPKRVSF